jgi:hypothetical protein
VNDSPGHSAKHGLDHVQELCSGGQWRGCVWQVHLAHFGGLIWPTRSR